MALIGSIGRSIDYWRRATTGPICFVDDFDKKVYWQHLKDVTKKHGIVYDPKQQIPTDDDMLDRLWQAAIDLILATGCLCVDTRRIIHFTREEILRDMDNIGDSYPIGRGDEYTVAKHRGFEDYDHVKNPVVVQGRLLGPVSEDIYHKIAMSYAQVSEMDWCHFQGNLTEIYGCEIMPGSPWEMLSEMWSMAQIADVRRQVGRPGLPDGGMRCVGLASTMSALNSSWGAPQGDIRSCLLLPHNKVEYHQMQRAIACQSAGYPIWGGMCSYPGGLSGSPAHSAVTGVAEFILSKMLFGVSYIGSWAVDAMYFSNTSKYSLWCSNYQNAAVTKNTHCAPLIGGGWQMTHGLGHENYFWESAASAMSAVVLGNGVSGGTGGQSALRDHQGGLGVRFSAEVGKAGARAKMTRAQVNDLVLQCQAKYQPNIDNRTAHTFGCDFRGCYDLKTVQPQKWYYELYEKVKKELTGMGLPMEY